MLSLQLCSPSVICFSLLLHLARAAASRTFWTAGTKRAIRTAMMAITTSSSISVNPRRCGMVTPPVRRKGPGPNGMTVPFAAYSIPRRGRGKGRPAGKKVSRVREVAADRPREPLPALVLDHLHHAAADGEEVGHQLPGDGGQPAPLGIPAPHLGLDQLLAEVLFRLLDP